MPARDFDFDRWMTLGKTNPDEFERLRVAMVERVCAAMGGVDQPHISGLLCRIELERQRADSTMALSLRLYDLMWERLADLDAVLSVRRLLGILPANCENQSVVEIRQQQGLL